MSKRESIKTSIKEIVEYWTVQQDECVISVDWADADKRYCKRMRSRFSNKG